MACSYSSMNRSPLMKRWQKNGTIRTGGEIRPGAAPEKILPAALTEMEFEKARRLA